MRWLAATASGAGRRRMGGGFGGEQSAAFACVAAGAAAAAGLGHPVKLRVDRDDDDGHRPPPLLPDRWDVGFDDDGRILGWRPT